MNPKDIGPTEGFLIKEDNSVMYYFHITDKDSKKSLCGRPTGSTFMELQDWGKQAPLFPANYCEQCKRLYNHLGRTDA